MIDFLELKIAAKEDIELLCERTDDPDVRGNAKISEAAKIMPAYCAYYKGRPVGAAGLHIVREGVANVWAIIDGGFEMLPKGRVPTAEQLEYLEKVLHLFVRMRDILCRRFNIKRIRTYSLKGFGASQRLLKYCGFERLRRQSADRYFYVYRRL